MAQATTEALSTEHTEATSQGEGRLGVEGTYNQTDRGTLGHCLLYIQY